MNDFTPDADITTVNSCRRQVVSAANKYGDTIIMGIRHFCPMMRQNLEAHGISPSAPHEQGFVDQWGNFMTREEAAQVIKTNGRFLRDDIIMKELYSENCY